MKINESQNNQTRVAIYIRVSTAEQKIDGYSLDAQKKRLLDFVEMNKGLGYITDKAWIFTDTHTGSDLNRPALNQLREAIKNNKFDAVLVWKIDRLSRSLKHLLKIFEEMQEHNACFISVQENINFKGAIGQLIFQIFGAIAQFERELIKGRTKMGKITSAELGNYTGSHIPYGYKSIKNKSGKGKRLAIHEKEKQWVEEIYRWYIYEDLGYGQIANKLNELEVPRGDFSRTTNKFLPWTDKSVRKILQDTIYRGSFVANMKDEEGNELPEEQWTIVDIPSCVSEFVFQQAQNACHKKTAGKKNTQYLLSGKLVDMTLDKPKKFTGARRHKGGFSYRRKQFKDDDGTHIKVFEIPGKQMEEFVWSKITEALEKPKVFINHYLSREYSDPTKIQQLNNQLSNLREQRANTDIKISRIEEAFENGTYSEEKMADKISKYDIEIENIENKIQEIEDDLNFIGSVHIEVGKLKEASKQVQYKLDNLSIKEKKILVELFVDRVEMYRKRNKNKKWDITAEIFMRFNPNKFNSPTPVGRTEEELVDKLKAKKNPSKGSSGAREKT